MSNQDEIDRIQSIRQRQIDARDPGKKVKRTQTQIAKKYKRVKSKENFFIDGWKALSGAWKGFFYGGIIGLIIFFILPSFFPGPAGTLFGVSAILVCMIIGVAIGSSFDWRDNLRDKL